MAMSALIKSLEDIMRKDAGLNGDAQYIEPDHLASVSKSF